MDDFLTFALGFALMTPCALIWLAVLMRVFNSIKYRDKDNG